MLVGVCGGICAGKQVVVDYLVRKHHFQVLHLAEIEQSPSNWPEIEQPPSNCPEIKQCRRHPGASFSNIHDLLQHATKYWQADFVTTCIHDENIADTLCARPFVLLLHVDAPISLRWQRFKHRCAEAAVTPPSLEHFVQRNDHHHYSPITGLATLASRAQIKLLNSTPSIPQLWATLDAINLTDPSRIRPAWDHYFMTLASLAARRSNCMRRQVGCVLVRNKRVMATGYNGTPRNVMNCNDGGCPRCNGRNATAVSGGADLSTCLCIHAEENALLEAGRERVGDGGVLYCNTCPCLTCTIKIVQVGITKVVFSQSYYMDKAAANIFEEAGVKLRQYSPPKEGLVDLNSLWLELVKNDKAPRLIDRQSGKEKSALNKGQTTGNDIKQIFTGPSIGLLGDTWTCGSDCTICKKASKDAHARRDALASAIAGEPCRLSYLEPESIQDYFGCSYRWSSDPRHGDVQYSAACADCYTASEELPNMIAPATTSIDSAQDELEVLRRASRQMATFTPGPRPKCSCAAGAAKRSEAYSWELSSSTAQSSVPQSRAPPNAFEMDCENDPLKAETDGTRSRQRSDVPPVAMVTANSPAPSPTTAKADSPHGDPDSRSDHDSVIGIMVSEEGKNDYHPVPPSEKPLPVTAADLESCERQTFEQKRAFVTPYQLPKSDEDRSRERLDPGGHIISLLRNNHHSRSLEEEEEEQSLLTRLSLGDNVLATLATLTNEERDQILTTTRDGDPAAQRNKTPEDKSKEEALPERLKLGNHILDSLKTTTREKDSPKSDEHNPFIMPSETSKASHGIRIERGRHPRRA
ncbi:hypothetical protein AC579_4415 [Pseudocercospora musae]|uniref:Deoxycytidylate deaminase n=1 Tax=Pseudocercospora musae TaxID=113226 RepID=A0A139IJL9_9PEZI|nr:hypothetical protein AC579_4415 [Pseudocercospora musae]